MRDFLAFLRLKKNQSLVIITDNFLKKHYGLPLQKLFQQAGQQAFLLAFPQGEQYKNYKTQEILINKLHQYGCDRDTLILALGGGVVGDLAGFIAATYLRGIAYVQIPTTLLAMVDSSVGGKTAINTKEGKNLIGSIHHPEAVLINFDFLNTLNPTQKINGLIEAIKMFLTHDAESFNFVEHSLDTALEKETTFWKQVVLRAINIKAGVISRDDTEQGERSLLNFGHTIGHALEKITHYKLLHGYAVGYGILVEASLSYILGLMSKEALERIKILLSRLSIHGQDLKQYALTDLIQATRQDKKRRQAQVHYILLKTIGLPYIFEGQCTHAIAEEQVIEAIHFITGVDHGR